MMINLKSKAGRKSERASLVVLIFLSVFWRSSTALSDENNKLFNLGRLSIARVYASSERKGSHGIQKVFDGSMSPRIYHAVGKIAALPTD